MAQYKPVKYMTPKDFTDMVNLRDPDADNVVTMLYGPDDVSLRIYNDRAPLYWTSYDDEYIIFDSWDSEEETTINANKTQVFVTQEKSLTIADDTVIDLPANLVQYLLAMAEAKYKSDNQQADPKIEQIEHRQRIRAMRNKWRQGRMNYEGPDYGKN